MSDITSPSLPDPIAITSERYIEANIQTVYDYVTQPDRWHEWHPSSVSADTGMHGPLPGGQRFSEIIDLLGLKVRMDYRVLIADSPWEFKTLFSSFLADGTIHYRLKARGRGTVFKRTFKYVMQIQPGGLHTRLVDTSETAMNRLKARLESAVCAPT